MPGAWGDAAGHQRGVRRGSVLYSRRNFRKVSWETEKRAWDRIRQENGLRSDTIAARLTEHERRL
jgi:hypothetical protein